MDDSIARAWKVSDVTKCAEPGCTAPRPLEWAMCDQHREGYYRQAYPEGRYHLECERCYSFFWSPVEWRRVCPDCREEARAARRAASSTEAAA
jgi:hypothetical protein